MHPSLHMLSLCSYWEKNCSRTTNQYILSLLFCRYRLEFSIHEKETEATFVLLDEAAGDLIGRKAAELTNEYVEVTNTLFPRNL